MCPTHPLGQGLLDYILSNKHTRMWPLTRSGLWCQIGLITSSSLAIQKAHSATVS